MPEHASDKRQFQTEIASPHDYKSIKKFFSTIDDNKNLPASNSKVNINIDMDRIIGHKTFKK